MHPEALTWTALLARWVEFARGSLALPKDQTGRAWGESIAPIIELQAVTFALAQIGELAPEERPIALDKAEILIDRSDAALKGAWREEDAMPEGVAEIISDARAAHAAATRGPDA